VNPSRRAILCWAARLFRREWRQQVLVLVLLTLAVGAAIFGAAAAYNVAATDATAEFGTAQGYWILTPTDPAVLQSEIERARAELGEIDIVQRWQAALPGTSDFVEYRSLDPNGHFTAAMVALDEGRYPGAGEVAITDGLASLLGLKIGDQLALDGVSRTITAIVESPGDLNADFALVAPSETIIGQRVLVYTGGDSPPEDFHFAGVEGGVGFANHDAPPNAVAAMIVLGVAAVAMLLVALIAAGSFAVLAQRRLRQLGMLAAIGADERQVRFVVVANGLIVGLVSALAGTVLGIVVWIAALPLIEGPVGRRLDVSNLPVWLVLVSMLLAVLASTGAAW
jgi:putative ABC transport system permease protein